MSDPIEQPGYVSEIRRLTDALARAKAEIKRLNESLKDKDTIIAGLMKEAK